MAKSLGSLIALPEELRYEVYYYALLEASPHGSILRPASVHTKKASGSDNRPTPAEIASIVDGQGVSGLMRVAKTQKTAPLLLVSKKVSAEAMRVRQQVQKVRLIANGITSMELLFNHAGLCHPTLRNILGHRHFEIIWPQREGIRLYTFIEAIRSFLYDICDREKILVFNSGLRTIKGVLNCTPTGPGDQHIRDVMAILNEKQDSELQMLEEGDSEAEEGSGASKFSIRLSLPRYPQTDYRWYAWEQGPSRGTRSDGEHPEFAAWVSKFENYVKRVGQAQARDEVKAAHDASSSPST